MRTVANYSTHASSFSASEKKPGRSSDAILPPPAVHFSSPNAGRQKRTRIKESTRSLRVYWDRALRKFGAGTAPSSSSVDFDADSLEDEGAMLEHFSGKRKKLEEAEEIDEVVVDREWGEDLCSTTHSEHGERSGASHPGVASGTDTASVAGLPDDSPHGGSNVVYAYLRWRLWSSARSFFYTSFMDKKHRVQRPTTWVPGSGPSRLLT